MTLKDTFSNKVQFLLDAIRGFINIEQNDLFKVLTIVSVVGIPPTVVAGIYGMNFKFMPELAWQWGYPFGLALILLSALVPLIWFKWRGWIYRLAKGQSTTGDLAPKPLDITAASARIISVASCRCLATTPD
jgi:CorA-like Mg2+ transporter protein